MRFCDEIQVGLTYDQVLEMAKKVSVARINTLHRDEGFLHLHSKRMIQGWVCSMTFVEGTLTNSQNYGPH
jgi:hypothetical protein